jgi:hypothetical protein
MDIINSDDDYNLNTPPGDKSGNMDSDIEEVESDSNAARQEV